MNRVKSLCLLFAIFVYGCSSVKEIVHSPNTRIAGKVSDLIETVTQTGMYHPDLGSGDTFLYLMQQGIPLSISNIAFLQLSGNQLFENIQSIDEQYLFSQLINKVFICDSTVRLSTVILDYLDFEEKDLFKITSPTYNGTFLQSAIYPVISDTLTSWSSFKHELCLNEIVEKWNKRINITIPYLRIAGDFTVLMINRPWFDPEVVQSSGRLPFKKIAIIEGVVFVKDFEVEAMNGMCRVRLYKRKKQYKIIENSVSTSIKYPTTIIGFYCRIL